MSQGNAKNSLPGASGPASGDLSGNYPGPTVIKINGVSVPSGGSLTTGNVLQVSGVSSLAYGPVNLAGGPNYVVGQLPATNISSMFGDVTGSIAANTVVKIQNNPVHAGLLGTGTFVSAGAAQDGYTFVWDAADGYWLPGNGWVTGSLTNGRDIDFTAISSTYTFSSDTTNSITINGFTYNFTSVNTAHSSPAMTMSNGTGLHIVPTGSNIIDTDVFSNTISIASIYLQLSQLIPNLDLTTNVRVWMYESTSNQAALFDQTDMLLASTANGFGKFYYVAKRQYGVAGPGGQVLNFFNNNNGVGSPELGPSNTVPAFPFSNNVLVLETIDGIGSGMVRAMGGTWNNGWPTISSLNPYYTMSLASSTFFAAIQNMGQVPSWIMIVGAGKSNQSSGTGSSTYNATIPRIRIDYKY